MSDQADSSDAVCYDLRLVDELMCENRGVAAQAAYYAGHKESLTKARINYDSSQKAYSCARLNAVNKADDMRNRTEQLTDQIRCMIEQNRDLHRIDEAFDTVERQLRDCEAVRACEEVCDFDLDTTGLGHAELIMRIDRYQQRVDAAEERFSQLQAEPAALEKRLIDIDLEIDTITAALEGDPASIDVKRIYAAALVGRRHIETIWNGFDEIRDYIEHLSRALTDWVTGAAAVSSLTRARAVADCKREAVDMRCKELRTNMIDEVLAVYDTFQLQG
jgi:chromosome segregation ATPase